MPRDRKESDVPNDSEEDSSSEDSSGSDSGSSSSGSNGSESDSKKTSGEKRDSSHKTGSPGRAGRNNEINSSGRGKEKSGENGSDHGRDNDGYKHRNSRDKTDERTKVKDAEGDISSDGEQITRSGPRSTIVQKSSVTRKDSETKERSEDLGKRTLFKEPEKRDRERRDDDEESQRRRKTRSRSPRNRDSDRGKDYRGRDDKPRRPDNRDDKGRQRDRDDDSRKHENRRREERQDYDRSRRDREVDDKRRDRDEGNQDERSRRDREPGGQRKVRDEGHQDNDRSRRDRDGESGRRGRDEGRRDDWRRERETTRARSDDRDRRHERDRDLRNDARQNDDKENRRDENTSRKRPADEGEQVKGKEDMGQPVEKKSKTAEEELLTSRTGGAYIPPARLRMMQAQITDKSSVPYQRMAWEALKKSVNGLINKVNVSNIVDIVRELFQENIVRGRGLLARSVVQAQAASPTFTHVYAALVAIINTKFPQIGELILQRLILQFKRGYRRNDKSLCMSSTRFIAHLVNQQVAHEVISLEILTLLLENVTEDSVEVAVSFLKECGQKLTEVSPKGINAIFDRLRSVLHEGQIDKRVQYMVEVMFAIRKDGFKDHPAVIADLDLVEEDDQFTHLLTLEDVTTAQDELNVFKADDRYIENEEKYKTLKKEILDEGSSDEESGDESGSDSSSEEEEQEEEAKQDIIDNTETNMVALRRTIYLTIQSSLDFEECAHKLLKMEMKPGQEVELCYMILDCCAQLRTYEKFFGLLAQRFCQLDKKYVEPYQNIFREQFETIHRLDTNKLRNVAKFFAHLLHTDAISWGVMSCMKLTEEDTTSASRIFIKILFLELSEYMGLPKLNARLRDPTLQEYFEGIMPRNNPKDTRFAINFFTTIGLGGLTEDLREHLKGISKQLMQQKQQQQQDQAQSSSSSDSSESGSSDSGSSDSSESDSSDSDSSDSDSESSESSSNSEAERRRKKKDTGRGRQDGGTRRPQGQRRANRQDQARERLDAGGMNGVTRADGRPRIEDKLLKLSLAGEAPIIDFSHSRASSNPPQDRSKRGNRPKGKRGFRNKRQGRRNHRLSGADTGGRGRNSDCDYRANSSYDGQNSDRGDAGMERDYYRGDRIARDDRIVSRPRSPDVEDRRDRHHMVSEEMMMERRGRRREVDVSPRGDRGDSMRSPRRDHRDADRSPQRRDRRVIDVSPRHADRREAPSPRRRGDVASPPRYGMESPPRRGGGRDTSSISNRGDRRDANSPPRLVDRRDFDGAPPRRDRREVASPNRGDYESSPHHRDRRREPTDSSHRRETDRSPPMGTRKEQKQVEYSRNGSRRGGVDRYSHMDRRSSGRSPSPNPVRESRKEKRAREQEVVSSSPDNGDHQKHLGHRDRHAMGDRTKDRRRR